MVNTTNTKKVRGADLPPVWVLSLGAGVQSTTLALMHLEGELGLPCEHMIFADTGWEPAATYKHLAWLEAHRVKRAGLKIQEEALAAAAAADGSSCA